MRCFQWIIKIEKSKFNELTKKIMLYLDNLVMLSLKLLREINGLRILIIRINWENLFVTTIKKERVWEAKGEIHGTVGVEKL